MTIPEQPRRAITVVPSIAVLRTGPGPALAQYVFPLDGLGVYRWSPGTTATDDGRTVLNASGGFLGAYLLVRPASDAGTNLPATAAQTLTLEGGAWYTIPAGTLTENIALTLDTANAVVGDCFEITRLDVSGFTVAIINGGVGAGTLVTLPASARSFAKGCFNGTNYVIRDSHLML